MRVRRDADTLSHPANDWCLTSAANDAVFDTVVIGAGQAGVGVLNALRKEHVRRAVAIDSAARDREGCWRTYARMPHLRTPKQLNGFELGLASASFRAYYEALFGAAAYAALDKIPTGVWADYLLWVRDALALHVINDTTVERVRWNGSLFELSTTTTSSASSAVAAAAEKKDRFLARTVVLARGRAANWFVPESLRAAVPAERLFHSSDPRISALELRGKSVLVVGVGASGLDHAEFAAERGARVVALARRKQDMTLRPNFFVWAASNVGVLKHFADLSDADKFRLQFEFQVDGEPAPLDTYQRALAKGAQFVSGEIARFAADGREVELRDGRRFAVDYVIAATGNATTGDGLSGDAALARDIAPHIKVWRDVHQPTLSAEQAAAQSPSQVSVARAAAMRDSLLAQPYLGADFSLTPRTPADEWVRNVFCVDYASAASHGVAGLGVTGLKYALPRIADGITRRLFLGEFAAHRQSWQTFRETGNITLRVVGGGGGVVASATTATTATPTPRAIERLNALTSDEFVAHLRPIFNTPLLDFALESAAKARPFASAEALVRHLSDVVHNTTSAPNKRAILAAHDRLAITPKVELGKDALREQQGSGLLALDATRHARFATLNAAYEAKFGHPFVMAVAGKPIDEILRQMETRLANTNETELVNGTIELLRVAALRLERMTTQ